MDMRWLEDDEWTWNARYCFVCFFLNGYALCMINGGLYADSTERQMVLSTAEG